MRWRVASAPNDVMWKEDSLLVTDDGSVITLEFALPPLKSKQEEDFLHDVVKRIHIKAEMR